MSQRKLCTDGSDTGFGTKRDRFVFYILTMGGNRQGQERKDLQETANAAHCQDNRKSRMYYANSNHVRPVP